MDYSLVFTTVLHGLVFTSNPASFSNKQLCDQAAHQLSGPNWVAECKVPNANSWSINNNIFENGYGDAGRIPDRNLRTAPEKETDQCLIPMAPSGDFVAGPCVLASNCHWDENGNVKCR